MPLQYALVTPTFRLDREQAELNVETAVHFVAPHVRQYLVIDRRDVPLFKHLRSSRVELMTVEDVIPRWIFRVPGVRKFWMSLRSRPIRNWILQQMVKLTMPTQVREDVLLYTDSDTFFVAPFDPHALEKDGKPPFFAEVLPDAVGFNDQWHRVAAGLLGLSAEATRENYVSNVVAWRRDNVVSMLERVRSVGKRPWQLSLAGLSAFSEYILYGVYMQRVLGKSSGQWLDTTIRTQSYWGHDAADPRANRRAQSGAFTATSLCDDLGQVAHADRRYPQGLRPLELAVKTVPAPCQGRPPSATSALLVGTRSGAARCYRNLIGSDDPGGVEAWRERPVIFQLADLDAIGVGRDQCAVLREQRWRAALECLAHIERELALVAKADGHEYALGASDATTVRVHDQVRQREPLRDLVCLAEKLRIVGVPVCFAAMRPVSRTPVMTTSGLMRCDAMRRRCLAPL